MRKKLEYPPPPPWASYVVHSKAVVLLLLIHCLLLFSLFMGWGFGPCFVMQNLYSVLSCFEIISLTMKVMIVLL